MKLSLKHSSSLFGIALLCVAVGGNALTLGRARGAVFLGQTLDITISVQQSAEEDVGGQCFEADVFHADTKIDAGRVRVKVEPAAGPQASVVRITSSASIDEPVVTVYLRAGCAQKTTRRYVLLADPAADLAAPLVMAARLPSPLVDPKVGGASVVAPGPDAAPSGPSVQSFARKPGLHIKKPPDATPPVPVAVAAQRSLVRKQKPDAGDSRARLKLDLAELTADNVVSLRLSPELSLSAVGNEKLRAEAVALWRAINTRPEDALREAGKVATLEGDVKSLRDLSGKNLENLTDLQKRLQRAESERFANGLVYGLLAALVLVTAAAAYFWNRQRGRVAGSDDWWEAAQGTADPGGNSRIGPLEVPGTNSRFPESGGQIASATAKPTGGPLTEVDIDLSVNESLFDSLKDARVKPALTEERGADTLETQLPSLAGTLASRPTEPRDFSPSMSSTLRAIDAEEVFDIRQQAEFFLSLGQYDRAVQVLENRIEEHGESSPFVYLDLLKIFHTLGRKVEFQRFRQDFKLLFKCNVSEFSRFTDEGKSIEAYPAALERVSELWPSTQVQEFIEDCIFRNAGDDQSSGFDLAAFSELLFLHAIAKRLAGESTGTEDSRHAVLVRDPGKVYADPVHIEGPASMVAAGLHSVDFELDLPSDGGISENSSLNSVPAGTHVHLDGDDNLINFELLPEIRQPK